MPTSPKANAFPTKRFFVEMLVRDIELQDAILDLLDNSIDGAVRSGLASTSSPDQPYKGLWARLTLSKSRFTIEDNCGGISRAIAENSAFRLGRPDPTMDSDVQTVGVYGIGMKRALFKIGYSSQVKSRTSHEALTVSIPRKWLEDDTDWMLPIRAGATGLEHAGTKIEVSDLRDAVARSFDDQTGFIADLRKAISAHYGYIIAKGFTVELNGDEIPGQRITMILSDAARAGRDGVAPYIHTARYDEVDIAIVIGMYRDLPTEEEDDESRRAPSRDLAGITIICNDRVVLYADKTRLTGWGEAGVPQYHTQFVSISGTVDIRANDASRLPVTTTKRGVDGNSELYLAIKDSIRDGIKIFTNYTYDLKKSDVATRELGADAVVLPPREVVRAMKSANAAKWSNVKQGIKGERYRPQLPKQVDSDPMRYMRFARRMSEIQTVAQYFNGEPATEVSRIAEQCFEDALTRARASA